MDEFLKKQIEGRVLSQEKKEIDVAIVPLGAMGDATRDMILLMEKSHAAMVEALGIPEHRVGRASSGLITTFDSMERSKHYQAYIRDNALAIHLPDHFIVTNSLIDEVAKWKPRKLIFRKKNRTRNRWMRLKLKEDIFTPRPRATVPASAALSRTHAPRSTRRLQAK